MKNRDDLTTERPGLQTLNITGNAKEPCKCLKSKNNAGIA